MKPLMSEESRAGLTAALWFFSAVVLTALFVSAAAQGELTPAHVGMAGVILALTVVATPLLLRLKSGEVLPEKSKRQSIEALLENLSHEDYLELKRRLSNPDDGTESVLDHISDDGELISRGDH